MNKNSSLLHMNMVL